MRTKIFIYLTIALAVFTGFACGHDGDTEAPAITLNQPEEGAVYTLGQTITLNADLTDNDKLSSYKVEIHNNFNGHTHGALPLIEEEDSTKVEEDSTEVEGEETGEEETGEEQEEEIEDNSIPYAFKQTWDIEKSATVHIAHSEIVIPDTVKSGKYHLLFYCSDASGNETYVARNIVILK